MLLVISVSFRLKLEKLRPFNSLRPSNSVTLQAPWAPYLTLGGHFSFDLPRRPNQFTLRMPISRPLNTPNVMAWLWSYIGSLVFGSIHHALHHNPWTIRIAMYVLLHVALYVIGEQSGGLIGDGDPHPKMLYRVAAIHRSVTDEGS